LLYIFFGLLFTTIVGLVVVKKKKEKDKEW
jgi:LPXTG-motif cell wall-anchored protein